MNPLRENLPTLPPRLRGLPVDTRGYPVPWFVAWVDGQPEFRLMDTAKWSRAVQDRLCWICGQRLGRFVAFTIGPMCAINRVSSEPPSHRECAEYAVRACPFLSNPHERRRDAGLPEESQMPAGVMFARNPGITLLWITTGYSLFRAERVQDGKQGNPGWLIRMGEPTEALWFTEGRRATREEVQAALDGGVQLLENACALQHLEALEAQYQAAACTLIPAEAK